MISIKSISVLDNLFLRVAPWPFKEAMDLIETMRFL